MYPTATKTAIFRPASTAVPTDFSRLKTAVLAKRPILAKILRNYGSSSLFAYARNYFTPSLTPHSRQKELATAIGAEAAKIISLDVGKSVESQLLHFNYASTADHHGPIVHPFFLSSNLLTALLQQEMGNEHLQNVLVLSFGSISLENSSFPRGIVFNSEISDQLQKLPFFSKALRPSLVSHLKAYTQEEINKVEYLIQSKVSLGEMTTEESKGIKNLLKEVYLHPEALRLKTYSEQITFTNYLLWKKYLPATAPSSNLVYLEIENVVANILIKHHLYSDTIINKLLFNPAYRVLLSSFEGIEGSYSLQNNSGTFLFWGVNNTSKFRLQMWHRGEELVSSDGTLRISFTPQGISKALQEKVLVPSTLLNFLVLACYYGLKCLGGFSQVNYLTEIKDAFMEVALSLGDKESLRVAGSVSTDDLCGDITVAFLKKSNGKVVPATGVDWITKNSSKTWNTFVEQCKHLTLDDALSPLMPELYKIVYSENERNSGLASLTSEDITRSIGLDRKIRACL